MDLGPIVLGVAAFAAAVAVLIAGCRPLPLASWLPTDPAP